MTTGLERFAGRTLGVATLHGKERVIGPALARALPLAGHRVLPGVDTDRFGAFSGEVTRALDPLDACLAKARHGAEVSGADLVIASEGSFVPYPPAPFMVCDEEFLVLFDARDGRTFTHRHVSLATVMGGELVHDHAALLAFAERMQFPEHQLVLRPTQRWSPGDDVVKGIGDRAALLQAAERLFAARGACWVETDLRAMANPTRMRTIGETAAGLATELLRLCPDCGACWFRVVRTESGLPCKECGLPTQSVRALVRTCWSCDAARHEPRPDGRTEEDPGRCEICNP